MVFEDLGVQMTDTFLASLGLCMLQPTSRTSALCFYAQLLIQLNQFQILALLILFTRKSFSSGVCPGVALTLMQLVANVANTK